MFEITLDVTPESDSVQKPRMRIKSQSVSLTKVFSGSEDSLVTVTCTMSVTVSKCTITCQWSDIYWGYEGESRESGEQ